MNTINFKNIHGVILLGIGLLVQACSQRPASNYLQIPQPAGITIHAGKPFTIDERTTIIYPTGKNELPESVSTCISEMERHTGITLKKSTGEKNLKNCILLKHNAALPTEGFRLKVNADSIVIEAKDASAAFYALQWLKQSLLLQKKAPFTLSAIEIEDYPEMNYRGAMLDVSRHFFTVEQVKRFIDLLAMHRLNYFHWHLTDDQGWRIEIKKYPELTRVGAWKGTGSERYGGFYTQEEIKEVIAYAKGRAITIIPEIDLPGHTTAALAAYPQLGCTGGPYEVSMDRGGVHKDVLCMGKEFSRQFVEDVLAEVAALFPSPYLHIGGDEVPRDRWKACPDCQRIIRRYSLKDTEQESAEDLLQSEFNKQVALYLKSLGKKMIGWDEVLSDNIDPETVIMSWRGLGRGVKAVKQNHPVIFSSNGHFYLNNYQSSNMENEPAATGGLVLMQKLYSTEIVTPEMTDKDVEKILGAEACLWASYVPDNKTLDYKMLPRLAAFAEVTWSGSRRKNYLDFLERLPVMLDLYRENGFRYAPHFFEIEAGYRPDMKNQRLEVTLKTLEGTNVYYTLDGSTPTPKSLKYTVPFYVSTDACLKAIAYTPSGLHSDVLEKDVRINKATFADIKLLTKPSDRYNGNNGTVLVDGVRSTAFHTTGLWVGYNPHPLQAVIDLGSVQTVKQVCLSSLTDMSSYIMGIESVRIALSIDGKEFSEVASRTWPAPEARMEGKHRETLELNFDEAQARYVKVTANGFEALPPGHSGAGMPPFLFVDEIEVY